MRFLLWGLIFNMFFASTVHADRSKALIQNQGIKDNEVYNPMFLFSKRFKNGDIYNFIVPLKRLPNIKGIKSGFAEKRKKINTYPKGNNYELSMIYFNEKPYELYVNDEYFEYNFLQSSEPITLKCKHKHHKKHGKIIIRVFKNKGRLLCWYMN